MPKRKFVVYKRTVLEIKPAKKAMHMSCEGCFFDGNCEESNIVLHQYEHNCSAEESIYVKVGKTFKLKK